MTPQKRQKEMIQMRQDRYSMVEIGAKYSITRQRVWKILNSHYKKNNNSIGEDFVCGK